MDFWPEFMASSWGREFSGQCILRIWQQQSSWRCCHRGWCLLNPVELIKIRLQLQQSKSGPISLFKTILRREGLKGIYKGLTITVLRDAPAHGLYFWTYEYVREALHPGCRKTGEENLRTMLVSGGLAGVASWVACYPLDVVKTRLQQDHGAYQGITDCFRKSVSQDGYRVLWRGLGTAVARAFVVNGAIFAAYEVALRCLFTQLPSADAVTGD